MDMMRRRSEPGLSPTANEAEGNRGDGGEDRQQMVQALTDGREVAMIQPTPQGKTKWFRFKQQILSGASGLKKK